MTHLQKTVIAPIIGVIVLAVQLLFGIEIPEQLVEQIIVYVANGVAIGSVVYGILKNHDKREKEQ